MVNDTIDIRMTHRLNQTNSNVFGEILSFWLPSKRQKFATMVKIIIGVKMTIAQKNSFGDVIDGLGGAGKMAFHILFHPLLKKRDWWGTTEEERERSYPSYNFV